MNKDGSMVENVTHNTEYKTLEKIVTDKIRAMILDGRLRPEQIIKQRDVAAEIGVSTMPVRTALLELASEGLVVKNPHRSARVAVFSEEQIRQTYLVRAALEGMAARLAVPNLCPQDISKMASAVSDGEIALQRRDLEAVLRLNRVFHLTLYKAAHCQSMYDLIESQMQATEIYRRRLNTLLPNRRLQAQKEHVHILQACENGYPEFVRKLTEDHLLRSSERLLNSLDEEQGAQ